MFHVKHRKTAQVRLGGLCRFMIESALSLLAMDELTATDNKKAGIRLRPYI